MRAIVSPKTSYKPFLFVIGATLLSALYWLAETFADTYFSGISSFHKHLLPADSHELWMRLFVVFLFFFFGVAACFVTRRMDSLQSEIAIRDDLVEEAELKSREELRKLSLAVEHSPMSVVITDVTGDIEYVNPLFTKITGYSLGEVVGKNPRIMKSGETPPETYSHMWSTIAGGDEWRGTLLNRKKSGDLYWEDVRIAPIATDEGTITHYVAIKEDITDRLILEEKIRNSEKQLGAILKNMQDTFYRANMDGIIVMASPSAKKLLGYEIDELVGKGLSSLYFDPERRNDFLSRLNDAGGELKDEETELRHKDGSLVIVSTSAHYYYDEDGTVLGVEGMSRDITKRKEMEKALVESEEKFRTLFENTPVSLWEEDLSGVKSYLEGEGLRTADDLEIALNEREDLLIECVKRARILDVNRATLDLHKAKTKEELFENLAATFNEESCRTFKEGLVAQWRGTKEMDVDSVLTTIDGEPRDVRIKWALAPGHEETFSKVFVTIIDITERKRMEEEIKRTASDLDLSNRMKELYIDILSHDILNPVNVIMNSAEILKPMETDETKRDFLTMISEASAEIDDLIDLAKKYSKVIDIEGIAKMEMDLDDILDASLDKFKILFKEKNLTVSHQKRPGSKVMANALIHDVFSNLISNAVKYGREEGRVDVGIEEEPSHWFAYVKDEGEGIPDEHKEQIFSRFERLDGRAVKGTGLGLAICKRIVQLHEGDVWVEDNPEGGSVFKVMLSKVREAASEEPA